MMILSIPSFFCALLFLWFDNSWVISMDACLVWHYGGRLVGNIYEGGDEFQQIVDTDRLGYWCLLDHAKEKLK